MRSNIHQQNSVGVDHGESWLMCDPMRVMRPEPPQDRPCDAARHGHWKRGSSGGPDELVSCVKRSSGSSRMWASASPAPGPAAVQCTSSLSPIWSPHVSTHEKAYAVSWTPDEGSRGCTALTHHSSDRPLAYDHIGRDPEMTAALTVPKCSPTAPSRAAAASSRKRPRSGRRRCRPDCSSRQAGRRLSGPHLQQRKTAALQVRFMRTGHVAACGTRPMLRMFSCKAA